MLVAVDATGEVVWYYKAPQSVSDARRRQNGNLLYRTGRAGPLTVLMFDNGNDRARPFEKPTLPSDSFSRAVEYSIDEDNMEVTQVWSCGGPGDEPFCARFLGDADWMPQTGNVLFNYGGLVSDAAGMHGVALRLPLPGPRNGGLFGTTPGEHALHANVAFVTGVLEHHVRRPCKGERDRP